MRIPPRSTAAIRAAATACIVVVVTASALGGCGDDDDTTTTGPTTRSTSAGGNGAGGPTTTTANGGAGGTGGAPPECMNDGDCTDPALAKCDAGTCVACDASPQCEGLAETPVCATSGDRAGTCVACTLSETGACTAMQTCNLLEETCADVEAGTLESCEPCTNDDQCETNHRCVPMDFPMGMDLGHYCLEDATLGTCERPYLVFVNEPSLNGEPATNYCGIDQDSATCPAIIALQQSWQCSGTPGMCSPDGIAPEVAVPGALCEQVGAAPNRCTYACGVVDNCPNGAPANTCGNGDMTAPGWCGG